MRKTTLEIFITDKKVLTELANTEMNPNCGYFFVFHSDTNKSEIYEANQNSLNYSKKLTEDGKGWKFLGRTDRRGRFTFQKL